MKLGISTASYYPLATEKALAAVVEGGAPCTEIFMNTHSELAPEFLRELRAILAGGQTQLISLHPFTCGLEPMIFFGDYPRRFEDGVEYYKRYFEATAFLGGKYLVLHGALAKFEISTSCYIERYERLHRAAKSCGVLLAQENVGRCTSRNPQLFRSLRQAIPDAAFVLDIKQTFRGDGDVEDFMAAMGSNLAHIHLSDAEPGRDCLPVGEGCFDFNRFFTGLAQRDYSGGGVLELYREDYADEAQLWASLELLEKIQRNLKISL